MGLTQFEETVPFISVNPFLAASSPGNQQLAVSNTKNLRIDRIITATDDTSDVLVHLVLDDTFGDINIIGTALIPAGAGVDPTVPVVDLLACADLDGVGLAITGSVHLNAIIDTTMTPGKTLFLSVIGGFIPS